MNQLQPMVHRKDLFQFGCFTVKSNQVRLRLTNGYANEGTFDATTRLICGTALRIDSSRPARKVIALIGQLWQEPCNSSLTVRSSVNSTNFTSPPSACKYGRTVSNACSINSNVFSLESIIKKVYSVICKILLIKSNKASVSSLNFNHLRFLLCRISDGNLLRQTFCCDAESVIYNRVNIHHSRATFISRFTNALYQWYLT